MVAPIRKKEYPTILRRRGLFRIRQEILEAFPDVIQEVMAKCIVTRCELRWDDGCFHYFAVSELFDEVAEGMKCPCYDAIMESGAAEVAEGESATPKFLGFERIG